MPQRTVPRPGRLTSHASQDGAACSAHALVLAQADGLRGWACTCPPERAIAHLHDATPSALRGRARTCPRPNEHTLTYTTLCRRHGVGEAYTCLYPNGHTPLLSLPSSDVAGALLSSSSPIGTLCFRYPRPSLYAAVTGRCPPSGGDGHRPSRGSWPHSSGLSPLWMRCDACSDARLCGLWTSARSSSRRPCVIGTSGFTDLPHSALISVLRLCLACMLVLMRGRCFLFVLGVDFTPFRLAHIRCSATPLGVRLRSSTDVCSGASCW